jgi:hypothetical protein
VNLGSSPARALARTVQWLGRWPIALAGVAVLAAAFLLPGLGDFGLWEPQERQLADRSAPRRELGKVAELDTMVRNATTQVRAPTKPPPGNDGACLHSAPKDALTRSLTVRAAAWGRDTLGDDDAGRRLPFAVLGMIAVLATAGVAMRARGPRAGLVTALVLLAMPLCSLQARQLTSEIGTASGSALIVYGAFALGDRGRTRTAWLIAIDVMVALVALGTGAWLAFASGGALLGLVVPLGAIAAAGSLGLPLAWRSTRRETPLSESAVAIACTLAAVALASALAYQLFDLVPVDEIVPGTQPLHRALLGREIVPSGCWSSLLGATWAAKDDLRYIFDSTFEQIAYGTFPWGLLAPIAMVGLLASNAHPQRRIGAIALAWAAAAWIATEVYLRKCGFTLYAGFPALALAVGVWLDGALAELKTSLVPKLLAAFVALGVLVLAKDLQSFDNRLPSLLIGGDAIVYPKASHLLFVPLKLWLLVIGLVIGAGFTLLTVRRVARYGAITCLAATAVVAAFWSFAWMPSLGDHLSSKPLFDTYEALRATGDQLVLMGDLGDAAHDYAPEAKPEVVTTRDQLVNALKRPNRVFAISPDSERCQLHRELSGKPYYVIDDRNTRSLLMSNRIDGASDKNPLARSILHEPPTAISHRPKGRIVFDSRVELIGWDLPSSVARGDRFEVRLYYKILQPVTTAWSNVLLHFDGPERINGDHPPIDGLCPTSTWQPGDYIVDTHEVIAGGPAHPLGAYPVFTGFFNGSSGNFKNMPVSEAPADMRDAQTDRVKIATIQLE